MTELATRPASEVTTAQHDPRDDWHPEARRLHAHLESIYGAGDPLPNLAGGWVSRHESAHTRRAYARLFLRWEVYARSCRVHPLKVRLPLAEVYAARLKREPTMRRVRGGKRGEMRADGPPPKNTTRAQALSACGSFYAYAAAVGAVELNPFDAQVMKRPWVSRDHSPTDGMLPEETDQLIATAKVWSPRSYALVTLLYFLGLRVDELLSLNADQLGYDRGHRVLPLKRKGDGVQEDGEGTQKVPVPPLALDALLSYLDGRTTGPMFTTASGKRWSQTGVWKHLRVLARHAGLPQAKVIHPHTMRHNFITDALEAGIPLDIVQDAAGHADPRTTQRYNRRRGLLEKHPAYRLSEAMAERFAKAERA